MRDGYADLLIIDAFVGARVPADLTTAEFLSDARRALSDHGVIIINLTDRGPAWLCAAGAGWCQSGLSACAVVRRAVDAEGPALRKRDHCGRCGAAAVRRHRRPSRKATISVSCAAWCPVEPPACRLNAIQQRGRRRVSGARRGPEALHVTMRAQTGPIDATGSGHTHVDLRKRSQSADRFIQHLLLLAEGPPHVRSARPRSGRRTPGGESRRLRNGWAALGRTARHRYNPAAGCRWS